MVLQLNPYLNFRTGTKEAMAFYAGVFGGEPTMTSFGEYGVGEPEEGEKIMHAQLAAANGIVLMAADVPDAMEHVPGTDLSLSLSGDADDAQTLEGYWDRLSEGGSVLEPLVQSQWGDRFGMLRDRYGIRWLVNIAGAAA